MTKNKEKNAVNSAIAMQDTILEGEKDINNVLTTSKQVGPLFHTHYVNMTNGQNGIENLISEILTDRQAVFPKDIEETEYKKIAVAASLFAEEIIQEVQSRFASGSIRYPYNTIHLYLSVFMFRKGKVGKIKLKGISKFNAIDEDPDRKCSKPRCKWYLIQSKA